MQDAQGFQGLVTIGMALMAVIVACIPWTLAAIPSSQNLHTGQEDQVPLRYSSAELSVYWSKRPVAVIQRSAEVVSKLVGFLVLIIGDAQTGRWTEMMPERAKQLRKTVEGLGATCVKVSSSHDTSDII